MATPPPKEDWETGKTAAQADAENVVGRRNRENVGLGGYGGRSSEQLDAINYQTQQDTQRRRQQQQDQQQQQQGSEQQMKYMGWERDQQETPSERTYLENLENRPGYYDPSTIGDTETQRRVATGENMGTVLESQRKAAELTPGTRDDQYFLNELSKWNRTGIETSSEYHTETLATGLQVKANPYENWGDVALAIEKGGGAQKDFTQKTYGFNPNVGGALGVLPGGQGLQETAWGVAKSGQAANADFQPAVDYLNYQKGRMGPYGNLYGGVPDTDSNMPPGAGTPGGAAAYDESGAKRPFVSANAPRGETPPTGKDWNPMVVSAAEPTGYISEGIQIPNTTPKQESQSLSFGIIVSGYNKLQKRISDPMYSGIGGFFGVTKEQAKTALDISATTTREIANYAPGTPALPTAVGVSEIQKGLNEPLTVAASYGAGAAFGTVAKGVEGAYGASRAAAAEQIISRGQTYRAAEQFSGFVMEKAPLVLGGMYGASIAQRSTKGFSDFQPGNVATEAVPILTYEAIPMVYGFGASGQIVKKTQLAEIGYKASVQEGATTGRFDYYVKQPVTKPIEMAKIDYASFKQEGGKGTVDYLFSKTKTVTPETSRDYIPYEGIEQTAYPKPAEQPTQLETNRNYRPYEGIEQVAYPKPEPKPIQPESQRNYYEYQGIERDAYPINSAIISAKAAWQEWRTPERLLYLSTYGGSNYISQGLPPTGWGKEIGVRGVPSSGKDDGGFGRIGTKTVGGSQVSGLKPEQSMFKMGMENKPEISMGETKRTFGQRTDYRTQPQGPMKPMDSSQVKQSAIQIERGEAPPRMQPPERISQPQSFDYKILQVQQPEQEQGQRSMMGVMPAFMSAQVIGQVQEQRQSRKQVQVQEGARTQQFDTVFKQMQKDERAVTQTTRQRTAIITDSRTDQTSGQDIWQTPDMIRTTTQRTDQKITPTYEPWKDLINNPPKPTVGGIPGGLPFLPGGYGGYGTKRRGRKFVETFNIGLDISTRAGLGVKPKKGRAKKGRLIPAKRAKKK